MPTEDEDDSGTMGSTSTPHAPRRLISDDYQKQIEDYCLQRFEKRFQSLEQLLQRHLNSVGISAVIQSSLPAQPLGLLTPFETDSAREARELFDKYQASTTSGGGAGHGRYFHPTRKDLVTFLLNKMMGKLTEEQVLIYNVPNAFLLNTNKIPHIFPSEENIYYFFSRPYKQDSLEELELGEWELTTRNENSLFITYMSTEIGRKLCFKQRSSDWRMVLYTLDKLSTCVSDELQIDDLCVCKIFKSTRESISVDLKSFGLHPIAAKKRKYSSGCELPALRRARCL